MDASPPGKPAGNVSLGVAQRIRWHVAFLAYRWARRTGNRLERKLGAVDAQREIVLNAMARQGRRLTQLHVIGAARQLQPTLEREFRLREKRRRARELIGLARTQALAARNRGQPDR